ncbi:MAG: substrate-binding domain-containing protein, partial [Lachnospiraceae bacterium]|nr:substrate-binding domain-containing protein [Lachnospiraceae bacterium]
MKYLKENGSLPAIASTIVILLVIIIFFATGINREEEQRHVSLIVYGEDSERWENLRQGAELVCEEKNADISLITMMSENDAEEQKDIINRETEDGTDALIIAACNSSKIGSFIKDK